MEMNLNLTFLVQIVHFIIVYVLISKLLLKPGYKVVQSDEQKIRYVQNGIIDRQNIIAHKESYKRMRWELFQDYFYKQKPKISQELWELHPRKGFEVPPPPSGQELKDMVDQISSKIKDKVMS